GELIGFIAEITPLVLMPDKEVLYGSGCPLSSPIDGTNPPELQAIRRGTVDLVAGELQQRNRVHVHHNRLAGHGRVGALVRGDYSSTYVRGINTKSITINAVLVDVGRHVVHPGIVGRERPVAHAIEARGRPPRPITTDPHHVVTLDHVVDLAA